MVSYVDKHCFRMYLYNDQQQKNLYGKIIHLYALPYTKYANKVVMKGTIRLLYTYIAVYKCLLIAFI